MALVITEATVVGMLGVIYFLHFWQRDLPANTIWNIGLKYLLKGASVGLLLTVLSYIINIQESSGASPAVAATLIGNVSILYSVVFWIFIVIMFFMVLGFTFDMIQMRKPN